MKPVLSGTTLAVMVLGSVCAATVATGAAAEVATSAQLPPAAQRPVDFTRDIQPIFEKGCLRCHGPERPKGRFRLDSRTAALAGGESGVAILPGQSEKSLLIHLVSGLEEDRQMPPPGKGDPLSREEIGLLRAWIDQGAVFPEGKTNSVQFSVTPTVRFISVQGNKANFREITGQREGWTSGIEQFELDEQVSDQVRFHSEGRLLRDDYKVSLDLRRHDLGFVRAGVEQWRRYYNDTGGWYPLFSRPLYDLDRDLHLDLGRAWIDFGLTLPNLPVLVLGYEYQVKDGDKSTLQWGTVRDPAAPGQRKNIYPAFKGLEEQVHILKFDVSHDIERVRLLVEDQFRAEFWENRSQRQNVLTFAPGEGVRSVQITEGHHQFTAANALRLEKPLQDWLFVSGGYLFSHVDAEASFRQLTFNTTGTPSAEDFWRSQSILLEQQSHLFNLNGRLGPWEDLTLSAGVANEWSHQEGLGQVSLDTGVSPGALDLHPARLDANLDKTSTEERVGLNYTRIPWTVLFADAALVQTSYGQFEQSAGVDHFEFLRDTDASESAQAWRTGFQTSPWTVLSWGADYRRRTKESDYNHLRDFPTDHAYPAFITERTLDSDQVEARVVIKPWRWLKATLTYRVQSTDYTTTTQPIDGITSGGRVDAGRFDADVYGLGLVLTPFSRLYLSSTITYYDSRMETQANHIGAVVPYKGDIYTLLNSGTVVLNEKTDLLITYSFSQSDYGQDNFQAGLPVGIHYSWHSVTAGISRELKPHMRLNLQYGFSRYDEPTSGGFNDFSAHAIFSSLTLRWP